MKYYHGTSVVGLSEILPPIDTNNLREDFRTNFQDCVFVTPLKKSAETYARKCADKFGGIPVVYEVEPVNPINILMVVPPMRCPESVIWTIGS